MKPVRDSVTRRDFLKMTAGTLAVPALAGARGLTAAPRARAVPTGVQLYCVRRELEHDMQGVLSALAEMGYEGVEFADYYGRSAAELRKLLDDNGLKCCGTHIYLDDLLGDKLPATVEFNQTLGNRYLVVRWLDEERRKDRAAYMQTIDLFNEVAERLKPHDMRVGYHNHGYIFQTFDGETLWNLLADHASPDVFLQLDTGNAAGVPGVDVVQLMKRNRGRHASMHIKPYSKTEPDAFLGEDELDWAQILQLAEEGGVEWYIIEYERDAFPPLEALHANLENFRRMTKA